MARNSALSRLLLRAKGADSADDRDVARVLRRALEHTRQRQGDPQAVQVAGRPLEADDYARWRERKLRRGQISTAPVLAPGRYALVLVAIEPATTGQFTRHGAGSHLTPPTVGEFRAHRRAYGCACRHARLLTNLGTQDGGMRRARARPASLGCERG